MPTVEQKQQAAAAVVNTADVRSAVTRQASASASQAAERTSGANAKIDRITAGVSDRPGVAAQIELLREDQQRQLAAGDDTAAKVFDRLNKAIDTLEEAQRHGPGDAAEPGSVERSQATRLDDIRGKASEQLRRLDAQRDAMLSRQLLTVVGMAADGSLAEDDGHSMERLRDGDDKELAKARRDLLNGLENDLENERMVRDDLRLDKAFAEWQGVSAEPRQPQAGSREAGGLATLSAEETAPLSALVDRIGDRTAELLRGRAQPLNEADAEKVARCRADFLNASAKYDMRAAGDAFHRMARIAAGELSDQVPTGWAMRAEQSVKDGRLDLLFEKPGKAFNVDWKPTGRSALGAVDQMGGYERALDEAQLKRSGEQLKLRQESRSWFDYIKPQQMAKQATEGPAARAGRIQAHDLTGADAGHADVASAQLRGAAAGAVADAVTSTLMSAYLDHLYEFARSHQVTRDPRSLEEYLRGLPQQGSLADLVRDDYGALRDRRREQHEALRQRVSEDALRLIFEDSSAQSRAARLERLSAAVRSTSDDTRTLARAVDSALTSARPALNDSMEVYRDLRNGVASRPGSELLFRSGLSADRLVELNDVLARLEGGMRNARNDLEALARQLHEQLTEQERLAEETRRLADAELARKATRDELRKSDAR